MDKMKMHSPDLSQQNVEKLKELFPNCVTESRDENGKLISSIDFDLLKQELSDHVVEDPQERYRIDWPGKHQAMFIANAPIAKTLRPARKESVDFDTTKNLFIEGDNLDALKLMQESYLGKVKMIYIDPPYNTGNDLMVYNDDFAEDARSYLERSNQVDEEGNRLDTNNDTNGRFHSDWLSMMYPRLKLARNLLSDDGVIFISVDDNEQDNLNRLCDEVFGEKNQLFMITVLCNPKGRSQDKFIANCHEYIIGYSKRTMSKGSLNINKDIHEINNNYKNIDYKGKYRNLELRNTHREFGKHNRSNLYYPFYVNEVGKINLCKVADSEAVYPIWDDGFEGCWTWSIEKSNDQIEDLVAKKIKGKWKIYRKSYAFDDNGVSSKQVKSIWLNKEFYTEKGQKIFNSLFYTKYKLFQSPKSIDTIKQLIKMSNSFDSPILDFFAGSGTTAHAVMQLNAEDGGKRQCISVQLPVLTKEDSDTYKAGYKNVAELSKERIRRAGKKIKEENPDADVDIGFRVLKVDTSNMENVYYLPDDTEQADLLAKVNNIKPDRTAEDLLFQVLLDWGVDLTLPIEKREISGKTVYFVDENALVACFDEGIDETFINEVAEIKPLRVVFRDTGFASDAVKINVTQIFKLISPDTDIRTI
ncbi:adenine-specific DNA-methyltransferase [Bartonella apis]|uniref:site-specific DNA-methyltransferase n=1 Tax=Bartonella apis TaxID=1686310 RepID=UPI0009665BE6|nr:site-specific DNA-methyltransferase [Bartonella apis]OLY46019.1 adenine-specific DNA-methyltransferase [Bartonella apis]